MPTTTFSFMSNSKGGRALWLQFGAEHYKQLLRKARKAWQEQSLRLTLTLRLLQRRFGPLPAESEAQLRGLSVEHLEALAEALRDFTSLADLTTLLRMP